MKIFAVADSHLGFDERIVKPMDKFGCRWENHAQKLKKNWEDNITDEDLVIIAGDISWGLKLDEAMADLEWIDELPGKKIITKGNHDLWWTSAGKLNKLFDNITFLQSHAFVVDSETVICGTRGWVCPGMEEFSEHDKKIYRREVLRLEMALKEAKASGREDIIAVLHFPPTNDRFRASEFTELMREYKVKTCVYGHLHGTEAFSKGIKGNFQNVDYNLVSLDYLNCMPVQIR